MYICVTHALFPMFVLVTAVFVTCLITANITAVKLVGVFGLALTEGELREIQESLEELR